MPELKDLGLRSETGSGRHPFRGKSGMHCAAQRGSHLTAIFNN
jgi:hypothetical protein